MSSVDTEMDELAAGTPLASGKYTLKSYVNASNLGIHYLAQSQDGTEVTVKEFFPHEMCTRDGKSVSLSTDEQQKEFNVLLNVFMEDADGLVNLDSANIASVLECFRENGTAYMVMEIVPGQTLHEAVEDKNSFLNSEHINVMLIKLLKGLNELHDLGLIHRDIEPKNITITPDGDPMLFIDFSTFRDIVGKETRAVSKMVSPTNNYASLEMSVSPEKQSPASDIYSLAASFYFAISGQPPIANMVRISAIAGESPDPYQPLAGRFEGYPIGFLETLDMAMNIFVDGRIKSATEWLRHLSYLMETPELIDFRKKSAPIKHVETFFGMPLSYRRPVAIFTGIGLTFLIFVAFLVNS